MLENFEVMAFGRVAASVAITKNGLTFNQAALKQMECSGHVRLLVNRTVKQFGILPCGADDPDAVPFASTIRSTSRSVRWPSKRLLRLFCGLMSWDIEHCGGYRVIGSYSSEDAALIFDLKAAQSIERNTMSA